MLLIRVKNVLRKVRPYLPVLVAAGVGILGIFSFAQSVFAQAAPTVPAQPSFFTTAILDAISAVIGFVANQLGKITILLIHMLVGVAQYNDYLDSPAVTTGWTVVRDISNMFFVIFLLYLSVKIVLGKAEITAVPRILIFALFINFSRTVAGLLIDLSQVLTITFVNAFEQASAGNFADALGITKIMEIAAASGGQVAPITLGESIGAMMLAVGVLVIATVVMGILVIAFIVRMVILWILVVLSPLAFLLSSFDATKDKAKVWWKEFNKQLYFGPILAFFLWLSLAVLQNNLGTQIAGPNGVQTRDGDTKIELTCGPTTFCTEENVIRYIISIAMLLAGLMIASEYGGIAGELSGSVFKYTTGKIRSIGTRAVKVGALGAAGFAAGGAIGAGALVGGAAGLALAPNKLRELTARGLAASPMGNLPGARWAGLKIQKGVKADKAEKMKSARDSIEAATPEMLENLAFGKLVPEATRKAALVKLGADKKMRGAANIATPEGQVAYKKMHKVVNTLEGMKGDEDAKKIRDEILEARPELAYTDENGGIKDIGKFNSDVVSKLDREKLAKLDMKNMSDESLGEVLKNVDQNAFKEFMERGANAEKKAAISRAQSAKLSTGAALTSEIRTNTLDIENVAPRRFDATSKKLEPNIEVPTQIIEHGNADQVARLRRHAKRDDLRQDLEGHVQKNVDYTKTKAAGGFTVAGNRISDQNLRAMEAATILDADPSKLYGVRANGSFMDQRARASFQESLANTPQKVEFIMHQPAARILRDMSGKDPNDPNLEFSRDVLDSFLLFTPTDIAALGNRLVTPQDYDHVSTLFKAMGKLALSPTTPAAQKRAFNDFLSTARLSPKLSRI